MDALAGYGSSDDDDTSSPNHSGSEIDDQNGENEKMEEQMETSDVEEMGAESLNFNAASEYSSQLLRRMSCSGAELVELQLPPPPPGQPDQRTMQKVRSAFNKMQFHGLDANENIKQKKSFRNPSIYQKLIDFLDIDEGGSNFPKDVFDPKRFREDKKNDYIAIANQQRANEERRHAAMKERSKIEAQQAAQKAVQVVEKSNSGSAKRSISSVGQLAKDKSKSRK